MLQSFLGRRSLNRIDLKEPPDKVDEVLIAAAKSLLQGGFLSNKNVDLQLLIWVFNTGSLLCILFSALFVLIRGFLVDESLSGEEVAHKSSLLHHVLGDWSDDTNNTGEKALNRVILEENIPSEKLGEDAPE